MKPNELRKTSLRTLKKAVNEKDERNEIPEKKRRKGKNPVSEKARRRRKRRKTKRKVETGRDQEAEEDEKIYI